MRSTSPVWMLLLGIGLSLLFAARLFISGQIYDPPTDADEIQFDAIAINLAAGNGFTMHASEDVIAAYQTVGTGILHAVARGLELNTNGLTTYRPPLYPAMLAAAYLIFGHSFFVMRILNCLMLGFGTAFLIAAARKYCSTLPLFLMLALVVFDPHLYSFSRLALAENPSYCLACLLIYLLVETKPETVSRVVSLGVVTALLMFSRPAYLFWVPAVLYELFTPVVPKEALRPRVIRGAQYLALVGILYLPWAIRNCLVLGSFMPLGSQTGIVLGETYYQKPDDWDGKWSAVAGVVFHEAYDERTPPPLKEVLLAHYGNEVSSEWIYTHRAQIPRLLLARTYSFWWDDVMPYQRGLLILFGLSFFFLPRAPTVRRMWLIALLYTVGIVFSFNIAKHDGLYGRYLCGLYPLIFLFIALLFQAVAKRLHMARDEVSAKTE